MATTHRGVRETRKPSQVSFTGQEWIQMHYCYKGNVAIRKKCFKNLHSAPHMHIATKIKQMRLFLQAFWVALQPALKVDKSLVKNNPNITGLNAGMSDPRACVLSRVLVVQDW